MTFIWIWHLVDLEPVFLFSCLTPGTITLLKPLRPKFKPDLEQFNAVPLVSNKTSCILLNKETEMGSEHDKTLFTLWPVFVRVHFCFIYESSMSYET